MSADENSDTPLGWLLKAQIRESGPIPVSAYMAACLQHPEFGYYVRRPAIGAEGDFITAPEISQIFGELLGLWCAAVWQQMGEPARLHLIELGPGRGALMADMLRSARLLPAFRRAIAVHLVESNATLVTLQKERLAAESAINWHRALPDVLSDGAVIVVANEFFDALPIAQYVLLDGAWRQRLVGLDAAGAFQFQNGDVTDVDWACPAVDGDVREVCEAVPTMMARFGEFSRTRDFAAVVIDYGSGDDLPGDTLQAVRRHHYTSPFAVPGESDLTTHVNFADLARAAHAQGLAVDGPTTQAEFLGALGIVQRGSRLMSANPDKAGSIEAGVARLLAPNGMGARFKAIGLRGRSVPPLPGLPQGTTEQDHT